MNDVDTLLVIGTDQYNITACILEPIGNRYRLAAWLTAERTPGKRTISQIGELCQELEIQQGRRIWVSAERVPFTDSPDPLRYPPFAQVFAAASPRPKLRVWLAGISQGYSLNSAKIAVRSGPADVAGYTQLGRQTSESDLGTHLSTKQPDVIVITGGFDAPDPSAVNPLEQLGRLVSNALKRLAPIQRPAVLFAGNRWAAEPVKLVFEEAGLSAPIQIIPNVQPNPYWAAPVPLVHGLTAEYWRGCRRTSEYREIGNWLRDSERLSSLELNFARLTQAWMELHSLEMLHGMYQAPGWWMHVLARENRDTVEISFSTEAQLSPLLSDWPPPQLVSGPWPTQWWPQPKLSWCDPIGLAPVIAAVGQTLPVAMVQVLESDVFS